MTLIVRFRPLRRPLPHRLRMAQKILRARISHLKPTRTESWSPPTNITTRSSWKSRSSSRCRCQCSCAATSMGSQKRLLLQTLPLLHKSKISKRGLKINSNKLRALPALPSPPKTRIKSTQPPVKRRKSSEFSWRCVTAIILKDKYTKRGLSLQDKLKRWLAAVCNCNWNVKCVKKD